MNDFGSFFSRYKGAIIGFIVAVIILALHMYKIILGAIIILAGIFLGNYIQYNKDYVKQTIKNFIDRM